MQNFRFYNPTAIEFGENALARLSALLQDYGAKKILLVYGGGSIKRTGLYDRIAKLIGEAGAAFVELAGVEPNPRLTTVHKGVELCRENGVDFILAAGGGSVIDASKAIAVGVPYEGDVWDFLIGKATIQSGLPLGTVLTHAATGSEMNGGSVITNWEQKLKKGFGSIHMYPKFSILDPTLTFSVPANHTAYGIADIMSHVFEQYFSLTEDTPLQERLCESILQTVIENGETAVKEPNNYAARANIMLCGTYALNGGMISVGMEEDWATHGIEHELSGVYDIPHGAGLAILFPNWMKYVYKERIDRFVQFAVRVWGIDPSGKSDEEIALAGIDAVRDYFNRIGCPSTLSELDIDDTHFDRMAEEALFYGRLGSFKKLTVEDVKAIYRMSLSLGA